ncbi:MAG: hypothetical protein J0H99_21725, partial [Rhodospirillales bacterium]|nr:hypothetical protein [Rhodospirillales bacterium]
MLNLIALLSSRQPLALQGQSDRDPLLGGWHAHRLHRFAQQRGEVDGTCLQHPLVELREVDQVLERAEQSPTAGLDVFQVLHLIRPAISQHQLRKPQYRVERRLELVTDIGEQTPLRLVGELGAPRLLGELLGHVPLVAHQRRDDPDGRDRECPIGHRRHHVLADDRQEQADPDQPRGDPGQQPDHPRVAVEHRGGNQRDIDHADRQRLIDADIADEEDRARTVDRRQHAVAVSAAQHRETGGWHREALTPAGSPSRSRVRATETRCSAAGTRIACTASRSSGARSTALACSTRSSSCVRS